MAKLKTAFLTEEANRKALQSHPVHSAAAASSLSSSSSPPSKKICGWCDRPGHTEDSCFAKRDSQQQDRENAKQQRSRRRSPKQPVTSSTTSTSSSSSSPPQVNSVQDPSGSNEFASHSSLSGPLPGLHHLWCADSGASSHMTPYRHWFRDYKPHVVPIELADGNIIHSAGIGSVVFCPILKGALVKELVISRVLHVPALSKSLLSLTCWTMRCGMKVVMENDIMEFYQNGILKCTSKMHGNISYLQGTTLSHSLPASALNTTASPLDLSLWHRRFSHLNYPALKSMKSQGLVSGLDITSSATPDPICEPCIAGNQRRIVNKSATRFTTPLHLVHADLHGPMPTASPEGFKYWCIFVDDATRFWSLYFLKSKSETFQAFKSFKAYMELSTGHKVKILHDDKGGEFMSNEFNLFCEQSGIQRRHTMRNEPHSNGVAERANQSISNHVTSLLYESKLPPSFWSRATVGYGIQPLLGTACACCATCAT